MLPKILLDTPQSPVLAQELRSKLNEAQYTVGLTDHRCIFALPGTLIDQLRDRLPHNVTQVTHAHLKVTHGARGSSGPGGQQVQVNVE
jgi:hypothetical protein